MSLSRLRPWLKTANGRLAMIFAATLGGSFTILHTVQDIKYEKERLKWMNAETATEVLAENKMFKEKQKLEKERKFLEQEIEDKYEFIPITKPDINAPPLSAEKEAEIKAKLSEDRLTRAFTRYTSLQAETELLMSQIRDRLSGRSSEATKYKVFQEFEAYFTTVYISGQTLLGDVDDIMKHLKDDNFNGMGKKIQGDVKSLVDLIKQNLDDIEKSRIRLGHIPSKK